MGILHEETTDKILKAYYNVHNELGFGFLEKVYENALFIELKSLGVKCERQKPIDVFYKGEKVGTYFADIVVEDIIMMELKAVEGIVKEHEFQLINYLKATEMQVGLLLNFGKKPEFRRKVFTHLLERR